MNQIRLELDHELSLAAANSRCTRLSRTGLTNACLFSTPGAFAETLKVEPRQTGGPFFRHKLPLDTDNDLFLLNDSITPAVGKVTYLSGRILGPNGDPMTGATIEIRQSDANGFYLHCGNFGGHQNQNKNFQGVIGASSRPAAASISSARSSLFDTRAARLTFAQSSASMAAN